MESDPLFSAYQAGLINPRVTATHTMPHHNLYGYLRQTRTSGLIISNIKGQSGGGIVRAWRYVVADGLINYATGQMEVIHTNVQHWPYGLFLRPVPLQAVLYT